MRGLVQTALAAVLPTLLLSNPHEARAQEAAVPPVTVEWSAPAGCPGAPEIDAAIAALLRRSTRQGPHVDAHVVVRWQPGDRYRAEVRTRSEGRDGRRTFQAATCSSLADATALLLALMIDPSATVAAPVPAPPPPAAPPPAPPPESPPATPPASPAAVTPPPALPPRRWSFSPRVQVGAIVDEGTLPGPQAGVEAAVGVDYGPLLVLLGGAFWPSTSYTDVGNNVAGSLSLVDARLSFCARPLALVGSTFPLWLCAGPGYEHESANLPSLSDAHPSHDWFSFVGGLAVEPRVGIFGLQLRADAAVPFSRQSFLADQDSETVFTPSAVAFRGSAGLVVHFP